MPIISPQKDALRYLLDRGFFPFLWDVDTNGCLWNIQNISFRDKEGNKLYYYGAVRIEKKLIAIFSPEKNLQGKNNIPFSYCEYGVVLQHCDSGVEIQPVVATVGDDNIIVLDRRGEKGYYKETI